MIALRRVVGLRNLRARVDLIDIDDGRGRDETRYDLVIYMAKGLNSKRIELLARSLECHSSYECKTISSIVFVFWRRLLNCSRQTSPDPNQLLAYSLRLPYCATSFSTTTPPLLNSELSSSLLPHSRFCSRALLPEWQQPRSLFYPNAPSNISLKAVSNDLVPASPLLTKGHDHVILSSLQAHDFSSCVPNCCSFCFPPSSFPICFPFSFPASFSRTVPGVLPALSLLLFFGL